MRKPMKNNLDEMQEQSLLKIESRGMWMAYYGLTLSILIQAFFGGEQTVRSIAGECILLLILSVYVCTACLSKTDKYEPDFSGLISGSALLKYSSIR